MSNSLLTLLAATPVSGVYQWPSPSVATSDVRLAVQAGWTIGVVHLGNVRSKADLFAAFRRDLGLPDWFGHNWDALVDALADWSALAGRRLVVVEDVQEHDHGYMVDILLDVAAAATDSERRFVVLVTSPKPLDGVRPLGQPLPPADLPGGLPGDQSGVDE